MNTYTDFSILATDDEFGGGNAVLSSLLQAVHHRLVALRETQIGVSFPSANASNLGQVVRLYGPSDAVRRFTEGFQISRFDGAVMVTPAAPVPATASWIQVQRAQVKSSPERELRRFVRRHPGIAAPGFTAKRLGLPSVALRSTSTGQTYRCYIRQSPVANPGSGGFNSFGMSQGSACPSF